MSVAQLRQEYHNRICQDIIRIKRHKKKDGETAYPSFADVGSEASMKIAWGIVNRLGYTIGSESVQGQTSGGRFEEVT